MRVKGASIVENNRVTAVNDIVAKMIPFIPTEATDKLKAVCFVVLNDYKLEKEETAIALYEDKSLDYYIQKFIVAKKVQGCSDNTLHYYANQTKRILDTVGKPLIEIKSDDIMLYFARRELADKVTKVTLNNERRVLSSFFAYLAETEAILRNPMLSIKEIKCPKRKKKAFTEMEVEKLRHTCKNEKETCIVEMLLSTGCRVTELVNMKKSDISDSKVYIIGKGNKERIVYLNAKAQLALKMYLDKRTDTNEYIFPAYYLLEEVQKSNKNKKHKAKYDFTNPDVIKKEGHLEKSAIERICRSLGSRCGISECYPHKFRRTCATMALKRGMPLEQVSKMLGHEKLSTTQIYLDLSEDELEIMHRRYVL